MQYDLELYFVYYLLVVESDLELDLNKPEVVDKSNLKTTEMNCDDSII